jgi:hypothetical protein
MMDNSYIELNGGYTFGSGTFDFGIGVGGADTTNGNASTGDTGEDGPVDPDTGDRV